MSLTMTNITIDCKLDCGAPRGQLVLAGAGISAVSQMTPEVLSYIQNADVVFYHATDGVMASLIASMNSNTVDLYQYYGEGKNRRTTYIQMAEVMLREVRKGHRVVGVFHGHPGCFVLAGRRAYAIAQSEGFQAFVLPGISSIDCMMSDLCVDPGRFGLQIVKSSSYLRDKTALALTCHVAILQVDAVGDPSYSFTGYKRNKLGEFFGKLIADYGADQESVRYMAPLFPGIDPLIDIRPLARYQACDGSWSFGTGILYIPPKGMTYQSMLQRQTFRTGTAYSEPDREAIQQLAYLTSNEGYKVRLASPEILAVMKDLASNAALREEYRKDPVLFVKGHPELSSSESDALARRDSTALRAVTAK